MQLYQVHIGGVSSHAADLSVAAVCLTWKVTWTSWVLSGFCLWLQFYSLLVVYQRSASGGTCFYVSWLCPFVHSLPVILIFLFSLRLFSLMMWIVRTQSVNVEPGQCLLSGCYTLEFHSGCCQRWIVGQTVASLHFFLYQDQTSFISVVGRYVFFLLLLFFFFGIMEQGSWSFSGDLLSYSRSAGLGHLGDY